VRAILALAVALTPAASPAAAVQWNETVSPHFVVKHEAPFTPSGMTLQLEKMHNRLRIDLAMFAPWMAKERVRLYLYKGQKSYLGGEFDPPGWSNGIAQYEEKLIATFESQGKEKLNEVIAHEMTHLLFEGYWGEANKRPPAWLNEGLAMLEERGDKTDGPRSEWYRAMSMFFTRKPYAFQDFLQMNPGRDLGGNQDKVTLWYVQAYSLVFFLYRKHSRLQFFNFCRMIRDGSTLQDAFGKIYRVRSVKSLEKAWRAWLNEPEVRRELEDYEVVPRGSASAEQPKTRKRSREYGKKKGGRLKKVGFGALQYHPMR
jgi:hypothetical protein